MTSTISHCASAFTYGFVSYKLMSDGLSNVLALEALPHGTDPLSNLKIRFFGGQPSKPDYKPNYLEYKNTVGYFYLYKDSEYNRIQGEISDFEKKQTSLFQLTKYNFAKKLNKWVYLQDNITNASILQFLKYHKKEAIRENVTTGDWVVGIIGSILSPPIYFHFSKIDPKRLEEDTNHPGYAYKTDKAVEPWRIGPIGACITGLNLDLLSRVQEHPYKVLAGSISLISSIALFKLGRSRMQARLRFAVAGALLS